MTSSDRPLRIAMIGVALLGPAGAIADGGKINERLPQSYEWRAITFSPRPEPSGGVLFRAAQSGQRETVESD